MTIKLKVDIDNSTTGQHLICFKNLFFVIWHRLMDLRRMRKTCLYFLILR